MGGIILKDDDNTGHLDYGIHNLYNIHCTHNTHSTHSFCSPFCSTKCRFFSECPKKGGFCSFMEQREMPQRAESLEMIAESGEFSLYSAIEGQAGSTCKSRGGIETVFWRFPAGKGGVQPWRRKLWDYQNKV